MFNRGRHRAPRRCTEHLRKLAEVEKDIRWYQACHERFVDDINHLKDQIHRLQVELGSEEVTEIIPSALIYAELKRRAPVAVPVTRSGGRTMLLPVGNKQARRVHVPSWAVRE